MKEYYEYQSYVQRFFETLDFNDVEAYSEKKKEFLANFNPLINETNEENICLV
jgi:hypothetical protein